ncbi:MAG: DUF4240 domain-containing protein [Bacteroidota bacterium]
MITNLQIKSNLSLDELINDLSQLDTTALQYLISSLQKIKTEKEQESISEQQSFWQFIEKIDWIQNNKQERLKPLVEALKDASVSSINEFSEQLATVLNQLDGPEYYENLKSQANGVSADTFLYARCQVVAKGKTFFEEVLRHPEKMPAEADFEGLLYVAREAYERKTGREYNFIPSFIYESFFNQNLWKEKAIIL